MFYSIRTFSWPIAFQSQKQILFDLYHFCLPKSDIFFVWKTRLCHGIIYVIYIITNAFTKTGSVVNFIYIQDDPNQNCRFLRAITLKLCISDPILVKRKVVHFFLSSKNCLHFSVACLQEKSTTSETHFGFTNMVSEVHSF